MSNTNIYLHADHIEAIHNFIYLYPEYLSHKQTDLVDIPVSSFKILNKPCIGKPWDRYDVVEYFWIFKCKYRILFSKMDW